VTHHGYVQVLVGREHPLADVYGYTYLHQLVAASAGHEIDGESAQIDHKNGVRTDNRLANLDITSRADHSRRHAAEKPRVRGRFARVEAAREAVAG